MKDYITAGLIILSFAILIIFTYNEGESVGYDKGYSNGFFSGYTCCKGMISGNVK